jgi:hypothetical protein
MVSKEIGMFELTLLMRMRECYKWKCDVKGDENRECRTYLR